MSPGVIGAFYDQVPQRCLNVPGSDLPYDMYNTCIIRSKPETDDSSVYTQTSESERCQRGCDTQ